MSQDLKNSIKTFVLCTLILMIPFYLSLALWYIICDGVCPDWAQLLILTIAFAPIVLGVAFTALFDRALISGKPRMAFLSDIDTPLGILFFACFPTFIAAKIKLQDYFEGYAWIVLAGISIALIVLSFFLCVHIQDMTYADNSRGLGNLCLLGGILLCIAILVTAVFLPYTGAIDAYANYSNHTFDTSHWDSDDDDRDYSDRYEDNDNGEAEEYSDYYVLNKSTKKIHIPSCSWADNISSENLRYTTYTYTLSDALDDGYTYCGHCLD